MKRDTGKARWDWLPWDALTIVAEVMTWGPIRGGHDPHGYLELEDGAARYTAAACRHISAHMQGEWSDLDSGRPHLAHAAADLLMVLAIELRERKS